MGEENKGNVYLKVETKVVAVTMIIFFNFSLTVYIHLLNTVGVFGSILQWSCAKVK